MACHDAKVQTDVLPFNFSYKYKSLPDYEAYLEFSVSRTKEQRKAQKAAKKAEKAIKRERREEKIRQLAKQKENAAAKKAE